MYGFHWNVIGICLFLLDSFQYMTRMFDEFFWLNWASFTENLLTAMQCALLRKHLNMQSCRALNDCSYWFGNFTVTNFIEIRKLYAVWFGLNQNFPSWNHGQTHFTKNSDFPRISNEKFRHINHGMQRSLRGRLNVGRNWMSISYSFVCCTILLPEWSVGHFWFSTFSLPFNTILNRVLYELDVRNFFFSQHMCV